MLSAIGESTAVVADPVTADDGSQDATSSSALSLASHGQFAGCRTEDPLFQPRAASSSGA